MFIIYIYMYIYIYICMLVEFKGAVGAIAGGVGFGSQVT